MFGIPLLSPADTRFWMVLVFCPSSSTRVLQAPPPLSSPHPCTPLGPGPVLRRAPPSPNNLLLPFLSSSSSSLLFFFFSRSHRRRIGPDSSLHIGRIHGFAPSDAVKREPASDSAGGSSTLSGGRWSAARRWRWETSSQFQTRRFVLKVNKHKSRVIVADALKFAGSAVTSACFFLFFFFVFVAKLLLKPQSDVTFGGGTEIVGGKGNLTLEHISKLMEN